MSVPSTKTLDHIVHLTPPGTLEQASQQFRDLGFNVIAGGTHADGLTANALVILRDGVYLELIAFVHPASHYPPGSPSRQRHDAHPWAHRPPGWIDYAFLGTGASDDVGAPASTVISHIVNARATRDHSGVRYAPETHGGRTRTDDGRTLAWVITAPDDASGRRGTLPFFCGNVTPRPWRVPVAPPSNADHPSGAEGVAHVRLLARPDALADIAPQLTSVVGEPPRSGLDPNASGRVWTLQAPLANTGTGAHEPRLVLSAPINDHERRHLDTHGPGVYEVALSVSVGSDGEASTPYGKIVWSRSSLA